MSFHGCIIYFNISLAVDIYLACFQFLAFIKKAAARPRGAAF